MSTMILSVAAPRIVLAAVRAGGLVNEAGKGPWPGYFYTSPDATPKEGDQLVLFTRTAGVLEGTELRTSEPIAKEGIQTLVRSNRSRDDAENKITAITRFMNSLRNHTLEVLGKSFTIDKLTMTSTVLFIGGTTENRREFFTVNHIASIKEN